MFLAFGTPHDTVIDHIEMALRGGYRRARDFIASSAFEKNPRHVDVIIETHARTLLNPLYPDTIFAESIDEAFARKSAWLLDAIDGNMNERRQDWHLASTLARVERGQVTAAGVYDIASGSIFVASTSDGRYCLREDGARIWLRTLPLETLSYRARSAQPRCLDIIDVIRGERLCYRGESTDALDFIAAAYIAEAAECVVRSGGQLRWEPGDSNIIVAPDIIAYDRIRRGQTDRRH